MLVLPDQPGPNPQLAVAAGKYGQLFIVNRSAMGGATGPQSSVVVGPCWCGPSYYQGADHKGRIVTSGGGNNQCTSVGPSKGPTLIQWLVDTSVTPALVTEATAAALPLSGYDGGVFTSISSNGETANTAIIWAINRPVGGTAVTMYAFTPSALGGALDQIWDGTAGTWTSSNADPDLVPTVANGRVYVGSDQELRIFGLLPATAQIRPQIAETQGGPKIARAAAFPPPAGLTYWGTIRGVQGHLMTIARRNGQTLTVDLSKVAPLATSDQAAVGRQVAVNGAKGAGGVLVADGLWRVKGSETWGADSPD